MITPYRAEKLRGFFDTSRSDLRVGADILLQGRRPFKPAIPGAPIRALTPGFRLTKFPYEGRGWHVIQYWQRSQTGTKELQWKKRH